MTVGAYFLALREEHKTDRGRRVSQSWVAQQVSALLHQTVHASTIGRIEKGGGSVGNISPRLLMCCMETWKTCGGYGRGT
jgi:hypothetical protein